MIENDTQNFQQAAPAALRNAPKLAKIAQAGIQGGPAGAAAEAAVQYRKEVLVVEKHQQTFHTLTEQPVKRFKQTHTV